MTRTRCASFPRDTHRTRRVFRVGLLALLTSMLVGCAADPLRRFPRQPPVESDNDAVPFGPMPAEHYSPFGWDAADHTVFRPLSRFFLFETASAAANLNALDEVPDSSWFTNRVELTAPDLEAVRRGACSGPPLSPEGPWTIVGAKPDGANPGAIMKAADGRRYIIKFDGTKQPERATAADVTGALFYYLAGYWAPCNQIVFFDPSIIRISPSATAEDENGDEIPLTQSHIDEILAKATRLADGRYRASASLFLEGVPIGPWKYQSTRDDDPNDVFPHEHRRELRGMYVLASWLNHFDSREQNTLAMFVPSEASAELGHVRHNMLDFGDCYGSLWDIDGISRRLGHAYYLDIPYLLADWLTFGLVVRPWDRAHFGASGEVFGYFHESLFEPDAWKPGYPNPAFAEMTERDAAWMARIMALFDDRVLAAVLAEGHFQDPVIAEELTRILTRRKERILRRWLVDSPVSPLTAPTLDKTPTGGTRLCLHDRALHAGIVAADQRGYGAAAYDDHLSPLAVGDVALDRDAALVCVALPAQAGATSDAPRYLVVDVVASTPGGMQQGPARVHLYDAGDAFELVGLERPYEAGPPR